MKLLRNLLALIGLVVVLGGAAAYVAWGDKIAAFDPEFPRVYSQFASRLLATGDPGIAMMWSVPVEGDLSPEDVIESMKSLAASRSFLFVGESPFYNRPCGCVTPSSRSWTGRPRTSSSPLVSSEREAV
jgi:hypothetical protein